tara:strand:+ start:17 stop:235 length:219 start_codon:yes stop_codon:yes gene_type:complete
MELVGDELLSLAVLILRKAKIEKELRKTFKCMIKKCLTCCGMKNIENELFFLNDQIKQLSIKNKPLTRQTSL